MLPEGVVRVLPKEWLVCSTPHGAVSCSPCPAERRAHRIWHAPTPSRFVQSVNQERVALEGLEAVRRRRSFSPDTEARAHERKGEEVRIVGC